MEILGNLVMEEKMKNKEYIKGFSSYDIKPIYPSDNFIDLFLIEEEQIRKEIEKQMGIK